MNEAPFAAVHRRAAPVAPLVLASDLSVPLGWVRRFAGPDGEVDNATMFQVSLVVARRERGPLDLPEVAAPGMVWVLPAVRLRPCLHSAVDVGALRSAHQRVLRDEAAAVALHDVLLPRPPGAPVRRPVAMAAGWVDAPAGRTPRRAGVAKLRALLAEHPGWRERAVGAPRARGRVLVEGWRRHEVPGAVDGHGAGAAPPDLAAELALLCPDGNAVRRAALRKTPLKRGERRDEAAELALRLVGEALAGGEDRPEVQRAGWRWVGASAPRRDQLAGGLRRKGRVSLRQLWSRADGKRTRIRDVRPALVPNIRAAARPFPAGLLWSAEAATDEAALVATAELLRGALRVQGFVETLQLAVGPDLDRMQWTWGDGSWASALDVLLHQRMVVAQVHVPVGHALHRRAVGAVDAPDPRGAQEDWRGRWGCPERRLKQSAHALTNPVTAVLAGPAESPAALVDRLWGPEDWPLAAWFVLGRAGA